MLVYIYIYIITKLGNTTATNKRCSNHESEMTGRSMGDIGDITGEQTVGSTRKRTCGRNRGRRKKKKRSCDGNSGRTGGTRGAWYHNGHIMDS